MMAARTEAIAFGAGAETALVELKPHWRPSEDEIELAAITVIFVVEQWASNIVPVDSCLASRRAARRLTVEHLGNG